jgi:hypothetical protein
MRVADIYDAAKKTAGNCDQQTVFEFISDALQLLNAKGEFDVLKVYLDLPTQNGNLVTLPEFVETPLKASIGGNPSFSRDRIYEFSMNGPGATSTRTTFGWEDRGFVPTLVTLPSASRLLAVLSTGDDDKKLVIQGLDANNNEITETIVIDDVADVATTQTFSKITAVSKDVTTNSISLYATANGTTHTTLLSTYGPYETEPKYRQIRLSDTGKTVRLLVRRKTFAVNTMDDFIPVQSKIGLLLAIKAILAYSRTDSATARAFEEDAARITTEAQRALTSFTDLAKDTEKDSARGLHLANRDSAIVADIYDDVSDIVGPVGPGKVFDAITEGLEALNNKGHWDGLTGYVDIFPSIDSTTGSTMRLTLPRYVESPITLNLGGRPMSMRNKWFEFHLNGPGSDAPIGVHSWDWDGDTCTQNPLQYDVQVVLIPDSNSDDGKTVTIYGLDDNSKPLGSGVGVIYTIDHTKLLPLAGDQKISRIDRIVRDSTTGFVKMLGYSVDQTQSVQLGYWYPDETEPQYMRIRVPTWSNWVRMRYRKRTLKVSSLTDPLHLYSRTAIITMIRSLQELKKPEPNMDLAEKLDQKAVALLEDEQSSRNPSEVFNIQMETGVGWGSNYILA